MKKRITTTSATQGLRRSARIREQQSRLAALVPKEKRIRAEAPTQEEEQRTTSRHVDIEDVVVPMQTLQLPEAPNASSQQPIGEISYEVYCKAFGKDAKLMEVEFYHTYSTNEYFKSYVNNTVEIERYRRETEQIQKQIELLRRSTELQNLICWLQHVNLKDDFAAKFERFYELRNQPKPVSPEMTKYHNSTNYLLKNDDLLKSQQREHIDEDCISVSKLHSHAFSGTKYEAEIIEWSTADIDIEAYVRDKCFSGSDKKLHHFVNKFTDMYDNIRACLILMKQCDVNSCGNEFVGKDIFSKYSPFTIDETDDSVLPFTHRVYLCVLQLLCTELTACLSSEDDSVAQCVRICAKSKAGDLLECTLEEYPAAPGNNMEGQVKSLTLSGACDVVAIFGNNRNVVHHEVQASFGCDAMQANRVRMQASLYANMYSLVKAQSGHVVKYVYSDIQSVGIAERYSRCSNDFGGVHYIAPQTTDVYYIILRLIYSLIENNEGLARKNCSQPHSSIHASIAEIDDENAGHAEDAEGDNIAHWDVLTSWSDVSDCEILDYDWAHEAYLDEAMRWNASILGPLYLSEATLMQQPKITDMFDRWLTAPQDEHGAQKLLWDYHTVKPILILKAAVSSKLAADQCKDDDANIDKENANPNTNNQRNIRCKC